MKRHAFWSVLAAASCFALVAGAREDEAGPPGAAPEKAEAGAPGDGEDDFGHFMQGGIRVGLMGGYRMVFRYDESPFCADFDPEKTVEDQQKFCGHASPLALDTALSFGMLDFFEPFLWGRFGLTGEEQTDTNPIVILGFGGRFYATADSRFKVFIEPAMGFELESGGSAPLFAAQDFDYKKDIVFHIAAGPQYDFARAFGAYVHAGLTTGIFRSIHTTLELVGGVQARFP